jgi:GTP-binding protein EngB required for normal cell division
VLAAAIVLLVASLAFTLLSAADSALSVWQRLQSMPAWLRYAYLAALAALGTGGAWLVWRLLHPRAVRAPRPAPIDRDALQARIERVAAEDRGDAAALRARRELEDLDARRAEATVQVALFGEISSGKSSLLRALAPHAAAEVGVAGGTTQAVTRHRGLLPDGRELEIADVPGTQEAQGETRAELARAEAARSHALIYVADGDLTRAQDVELQALAGYGRPLILALNKIDRYRAAERRVLLDRLQERYAPLGARVVAVNAGFEQDVTRELPDGRRETLVRERPADIAALQAELATLARAGAATLEAGREAALFAHVDAQLARAEREQRALHSDATVAKYTRRAVVGALAAVAPGTDLVIQGALAAALVRELAAIHQLPLRDLDVDAFLARAGGLVRTTTSVTLAVAGNALKAFPGLGTLGGGVLHAVAYGLIFDSLGRAVAQTLAETAELDREATLQAFRAGLERPAAERLQALAALALEAWRERAATNSRQEASR